MLNFYFDYAIEISLIIASVCAFSFSISQYIDSESNIEKSLFSKFSSFILQFIISITLYAYVSVLPNVIIYFILCIVCFLNGQGEYHAVRYLLLINSGVWFYFIYLFIRNLPRELKRRKKIIIEFEEKKNRKIKEEKEEKEWREKKENYKKEAQLNHIASISKKLERWKTEMLSEYNQLKCVEDVVENIDNIRYSNLLQLYEWKVKRFIILLRDKFTCTDCKKKDDKNHVHHLYYVKDEFPWEISDNGLVVLCKDCHINRHKEETIKTKKWHYGKLVDTGYRYFFCPRCNGTGYLTRYSHVENGICFLCMDLYDNNDLFVHALEKVKNQG